MKTTSILTSCFLLSFSLSAQMISGHVFDDANNNGLKDRNEEGIKGVVVSDQIHTVTTDVDGAYQLKAQGYGFVFFSLPNTKRRAMDLCSSVCRTDTNQKLIGKKFQVTPR